MKSLPSKHDIIPQVAPEIQTIFWPRANFLQPL